MDGESGLGIGVAGYKAFGIIMLATFASDRFSDRLRGCEDD